MKEYTSSQVQEAILGREIISLAQLDLSNRKQLESLSNICFSLFRYLDEQAMLKESVVDWHELFSIFDQLYYKTDNQAKSLQKLQKLEEMLQAIIKSAKANPS